KTVDAPKIEAPADVLIRITSTAICGTDLHICEGRMGDLNKPHLGTSFYVAVGGGAVGGCLATLRSPSESSTARYASSIRSTPCCRSILIRSPFVRSSRSSADWMT